MVIRKAKFDDKKHILEIINLLNFGISEFIWGEDEFVEKQIENEEYFLAEKESQVVGIVSFKERKKRMYIETLAVVEKYRFQGIGSQLVEFAKDFTLKKGLKTLYVCSFCEYKAQDFYSKRGFSVSKKLGRYKDRQYHRFEARL